MSDKKTHVAVYIGAPYAASEGGHPVFFGSDNECQKKWRQFGPLASRDHTVVDLDFRDYDRFTPMTPREYFEINGELK